MQKPPESRKSQPTIQMLSQHNFSPVMYQPHNEAMMPVPVYTQMIESFTAKIEDL
jgi:hypothetical protein